MDKIPQTLMNSSLHIFPKDTESRKPFVLKQLYYELNMVSCIEPMIRPMPTFVPAFTLRRGIGRILSERKEKRARSSKIVSF